MMKWTAFVGAAFIASSAAISIGSADPESMSEAYPEFHFAQLDLDTDTDRIKTNLVASQANKDIIAQILKDMKVAKAKAKKGDQDAKAEWGELIERKTACTNGGERQDFCENGSGRFSQGPSPDSSDDDAAMADPCDPEEQINKLTRRIGAIAQNVWEDAVADREWKRLIKQRAPCYEF